MNHSCIALEKLSEEGISNLSIFPICFARYRLTHFFALAPSRGCPSGLDFKTPLQLAGGIMVDLEKIKEMGGANSKRRACNEDEWIACSLYDRIIFGKRLFS